MGGSMGVKRSDGIRFINSDDACRSALRGPSSATRRPASRKLAWSSPVLLVAAAILLGASSCHSSSSSTDNSGQSQNSSPAQNPQPAQPEISSAPQNPEPAG